MEDRKISARGERAAMSGYLPQFDEFSRLVYRNLINDNLLWIKVADPQAEKLDDIQFATLTEVHAYQVKWTISDAVISFSNFKLLFPKIASSWKKIKQKNHGKKVIPHLITNKEASTKDKIKLDRYKSASFQDFIDQVWHVLKAGNEVTAEWTAVVAELKTEAKFTDTEFLEFISSFDFTPSYYHNPITVSRAPYDKEHEDLQALSRFILEQVASSKRIVEFSRQQILEALSWTDRFRTTFNHDLIVDLKTYQPIIASISSLNNKLAKKNKGYIFLEGGPGTGKSTMLTQWSKGSDHRIIKYYAFDFTNPASGQNYQERGNSLAFFFDLVFQIKRKIRSETNILPYKDLDYLRKAFFNQLIELGQDYKLNNVKTIIIVDGLDHIPREYKTMNNLIKDLPLPASLPEGVYILLGSQSFMLDDLSTDIQREYLAEESTVKMAPLTKVEVNCFIGSSNLTPALTVKEKSKVYESSQGHPLYLSYLTERLRFEENRTELIEGFGHINGDINQYYDRIWRPIKKSVALVELLGEIARVNSAINPKFILEWGYSSAILTQFSDEAKFLFNQGSQWSFFHNSFRQYLLNNTAANPLTGQYDASIDKNYHIKLAGYYENSKIEPTWGKNFHFFKAEKYTEFLENANPELFAEQVLAFRPLHEISAEAKLGIDIASKTGDVVILLRYLFALSEIENKKRNIDTASLTDELLRLGHHTAAKRFLRDENKLLCSEARALSAAVIFAKSGDVNEGLLLFNLAYPEFVKDKVIEIENSPRFNDEISLVKQWVFAAGYFLSCPEILRRVNAIKFSKENDYAYMSITEVRLVLLESLADAYVRKSDWSNLNTLLKQYKLKVNRQLSAYFYIIKDAIEHCISDNDNSQASYYLSLILAHFTPDNSSPIAKITIANLIHKVHRDSATSYLWIKGLEQPSQVGKKDLGTNGSLEIFRPLIIFNKLLNISGNGIEVSAAIPSAKLGSEEEIIVEFERMLCRMAQIISDGEKKKIQTTSIAIRIMPIVRFFYKKRNHRNSYNFKIFETKKEYYKLLVYAVSTLDKKQFDDAGDFLTSEFSASPKYWPAYLKRFVLVCLLRHGYPKEKIEEQVVALETSMLLKTDITGRIDECLLQCRAYLSLNCNDRALVMLKQGFKESIGVGYSEDYQFNTWIEGLKKVNKLQPAAAPKRLEWFLSQLYHIKQTTEGSASDEAGEKILEATLNFNIESGFSQLQWLLSKGLVDFMNGMAILLKECLAQSIDKIAYKIAFLIYTNIYLLFSESRDIDLLRLILEQGLSLNRTDFEALLLPKLIDAVKISALEQYRTYMLEVINEFCDANSIQQNGNPENFSGSSSLIEKKSTRVNELILEPYQVLPEQKVIDVVSDYDSLKNLVINESKANSFFDWEQVLVNGASLLSSERIKELLAIESVKRKQSEFFASLSKLAFDLNDKKLAKELAEISLENSTSSGWIEQYDGGSRIKALSALSRLEPKLTSKRAFDLFCHDIAQSRHPQSYLLELDNILPLICENYSEEQYWPEIECYLKRLMANSNPPENLPPIAENDTNVSQVLTDYILFLTEHPVTQLAEEALKILSRITTYDYKYAAHKIDKIQDSVIAIRALMYIYKIEPSALKNFSDKLSTLATHSNYTVRKDARFLLGHLGISYTKNTKIDVPAVYALSLPEHSEVISAFYEPLLAALAEEGDINIANLKYRLQYFIKLTGTPEAWSEDMENKIKENLEETGLRYPYRIKKNEDLHNALMHMISELEDTGLVDMNRLDRYFTFYDYDVPFYKKEPKPAFVPQICEDTPYRVKNKWVEQIDSNSRLYQDYLTINQRIVIGEDYSITSLDWGRATENFSSAISCVPQMQEASIFGSISQTFTSEYHTLTKTGHDLIVKRNNRFLQFGSGSNFIAINPLLARMLGWHPDPRGLFAWKDSGKNLMIESIYWSSGNYQMSPRKDSETGEGWIVLATKDAIAKINDLVGSLFFHKTVERHKGHNDEFEERYITKVIPFNKSE